MDPDELDNLWSDVAHRDVRAHLQEQLLDVLVSVEDRTAPRKAFW